MLQGGECTLGTTGGSSGARAGAATYPGTSLYSRTLPEATVGSRLGGPSSSPLVLPPLGMLPPNPVSSESTPRCSRNHPGHRLCQELGPQELPKRKPDHLFPSLILSIFPSVLKEKKNLNSLIWYRKLFCFLLYLYFQAPFLSQSDSWLWRTSYRPVP